MRSNKSSTCDFSFPKLSVRVRSGLRIIGFKSSFVVSMRVPFSFFQKGIGYRQFYRG